MVSVELSRSGLRAFWLYAVYDSDSRKTAIHIENKGKRRARGGGRTVRRRLEGGVLVCGYREGGEFGWAGVLLWKQWRDWGS